MNLARLIRNNGVILTILVIAAVLRLVGLDWSLPHVYEEATPLRVAVDMWGWESGGPVTLNPGFFNYPGLTLYIHFLVQGILFAVLRVTGEIESTTDWYALFLTDPTAPYLASRLVGVVFGALTVLLVYRIAKSLSDWRGGAFAAGLLAINPQHIARSQMIEVDVPLTFFVVLSIYAMRHVFESGRTRSHVLCGISVGLAASSKYTGWLLLVPLVVAQFLTTRDRASWRNLLLAVAISVAVFVVTSPYTIIDWNSARADLSLEQEHMDKGHFGSDDASTGLYYLEHLASHVGLLAIPLVLIGIVRSIRGRARALSFIMLAFIALYTAVISSWAMKAERYLLPVLPLLLVFAGTGLAAAYHVRLQSKLRHAMALAAAGLLLAVNITAIARYRDEFQHDARTDAQEWIESHIPPGAMIVSEGYGPNLLDPSLWFQLAPEVQKKTISRWGHRPVYACLSLPMYQVTPERSSHFYTISAYPDADYFITTRAIRGRYERDPVRFASQVAFYSQLEQGFRRVAVFGDRKGSEIVIFGSTVRTEPFGARKAVAPPPRIGDGPTDRTGREAGFYFTLGANYEYFKHLPEAAASYRLALEYGAHNRQLFSACVFRYAGCLLALGKRDEALVHLRQFEQSVNDRQLKAMIAELIRRFPQQQRSP